MWEFGQNFKTFKFISGTNVCSRLGLKSTSQIKLHSSVKFDEFNLSDRQLVVVDFNSLVLMRVVYTVEFGIFSYNIQFS